MDDGVQSQVQDEVHRSSAVGDEAVVVHRSSAVDKAHMACGVQSQDDVHRSSAVGEAVVVLSLIHI